MVLTHFNVFLLTLSTLDKTKLLKNIIVISVNCTWFGLGLILGTYNII